MIAPRTAGFRCFQSPSALVTEMKSDPKKTRATSGTWNRAKASGERSAAVLSGKSATLPSPITSRPGRNFRVAGFGVDSVWMNMLLKWTLEGAGSRRLEVRDDPLLFPIAVAGGFRAVLAVALFGQGFCRRCGIAAGICLGSGARARLADAGGDLGFARFFHTA